MGAGNEVMTKLSVPADTAPKVPLKQDVFVGFATVPGFVSLTCKWGSPYMQELATQLQKYHKSKDLADIHLLVKRNLAKQTFGTNGKMQGPEDRSSLIAKLLFSRDQEN